MYYLECSTDTLLDQCRSALNISLRAQWGIINWGQFLSGFLFVSINPGFHVKGKTKKSVSDELRQDQSTLVCNMIVGNLMEIILVPWECDVVDQSGGALGRNIKPNAAA